MSDTNEKTDAPGGEEPRPAAKIPPPPDTGEPDALRRKLAAQYDEDEIVPSQYKPFLPFAFCAVLFLLVYGVGSWGTLDSWLSEAGKAPAPTATLPWMMHRWLHDQSATHGWLVLPIAGAVIYGKRKQLRETPLVSDPRGLWLMALALLMHLGEVLIDLNGPSPLSIPIFLAGWVWYAAGTQWLRLLSFPLAYLFFMVPIPGFLNQFVSFPLRLLAHNGSKAIAGLFGIDIGGAGMSMEFWRYGANPADTSEGNIAKNLVSLMVADPCSGLHSLMAIKALHAITAYMSRLSIGWKWVLFWCALPISLAANVCRMVLIILVSYYVDKGFGLKMFHDYSPYLLFLFVFGFLFFLGLVMEIATGAYKEQPKDGATVAGEGGAN
jgi:exosortase/archaeosortase family protein